MTPEQQKAVQAAIEALEKSAGAVGLLMAGRKAEHPLEREIASALAALRALTTTDAWEPIETAPKDGRDIDMWNHNGRRTDCRFVGGEWCEYYQGGWLPLDWAPTHWRPLPAPPVGKGGGN